jgi:hypothetical protein
VGDCSSLVVKSIVSNRYHPHISRDRRLILWHAV